MTLLRRFHLNVGQNLFAVGVAEQGTGCPGGSADIPTPLEAFLCDLIPVFLLQPGVGLGSPRSFPIPKIWGSVEQPQLHCVAPPWVVVVWGAAGCGVLWLSGELCWALHIPLPFHLVLTPRGGVGGAGTSSASGSPREERNLGPPPAGESSIHLPRGLGRLGSSRSSGILSPSCPQPLVLLSASQTAPGLPHPSLSKEPFVCARSAEGQNPSDVGLTSLGGGDSPASPAPCEVIEAPALSPYVWGGSQGLTITCAPPPSCPPSSSPPAAPQGRGIA